MRVALVHDWLTGMRGGERVLEQLLVLFPRAEIFTLLHVPGSVTPTIEARVVHTSFVQQLPFASSGYRRYLPLFPAAVERLPLHGYDLVISSSHCVAKSARTNGAPHLCYCHTPMRYVWDQYDAYFGAGRAGVFTRTAVSLLAGRLRDWDVRTASRVSEFVANSQHVRDRIRRYYGRDSSVVYPPVDVARFTPAASRDDSYICLSALVPYKRVDLAISAFNALGRRLLVIGDGPEYSRLRALARPNIVFTGRVPDAEVAALLGRARGLVMPMVEDFGISAVEAQAAGTPVLAYAAGGALETVIPFATSPESDAGAATGILFELQTPDAIARAVHLRERLTFDVDVLHTHARRFDTAAFHHAIRNRVAALLDTTSRTTQPAGL